MAGLLHLAGSLHDVYMGLTDVYMRKTVGNLQGLKMAKMTPNSGFKVYLKFTLS